MADTISFLVDKQDSFEIVRDQIAVLINENQAAQVILAAAEPDPSLWKLRVYTERANPWELFIEDPADFSPIVNVWYESGSFDESKGDTIERQAHAGIFNVDVYAWAQSQGDGAGGHLPGDREAAFTAQRGARLVRNFIMASENAYLQLRAIDGPTGPGVWQRWLQSVTSFQPDQQNEAAHQVIAIRLAFRVEFNEFSPQAVTDDLELVSVDIHRASDGKLIAEADYDVSTP